MSKPSSQDLRDRAKRCRWLAGHMTDDQTLAALETMAVDLDDRAAILEASPRHQ